MQGFEVQYSSDSGEEVCIIPKPSISLGDFSMLLDYFGKQGYKYWIPSDERGGHRLVKGNNQKMVGDGN